MHSSRMHTTRLLTGGGSFTAPPLWNPLWYPTLWDPLSQNSPSQNPSSVTPSSWNLPFTTLLWMAPTKDNTPKDGNP